MDKLTIEQCDHDWEDITANGDLEFKFICTYCSEIKSIPFNSCRSVSDTAKNNNQAKLSIKNDIEDNCSDIKNHISPNTKVIEK